MFSAQKQGGARHRAPPVALQASSSGARARTVSPAAARSCRMQVAGPRFLFPGSRTDHGFRGRPVYLLGSVPRHVRPPAPTALNAMNLHADHTCRVGSVRLTWAPRAPCWEEGGAQLHGRRPHGPDPGIAGTESPTGNSYRAKNQGGGTRCLRTLCTGRADLCWAGLVRRPDAMPYGATDSLMAGAETRRPRGGALNRRTGRRVDQGR